MPSSTPPPPTPFIIFRSTGHSGSGWLSELLMTQPLAFFFEFTGRCNEVNFKKSVTNYTLLETFAEGCRCSRSASTLCVKSSKPESLMLASAGLSCEKKALCQGACPAAMPPPAACGAVGMVQSVTMGWLRRVADYQARATAWAVPAGRAIPAQRARIVTYERDNAIKHAISKLRTECVSDTTSQNHGDATKLAASAAVPSRLHIEPALLQAEALQALRGRRDMGVDLAEAADRIGPVAHELHYEDLQRDAAAEVRRLLEKGLGVRYAGAALASYSGMVKGTREDLRLQLFNFDAIDAHLRKEAPCLSPMLRSAAPERFDRTCGAQIIDTNTPNHARQDASSHALRCGGGGGRQCTLLGRNRLAARGVLAAEAAARGGSGVGDDGGDGDEPPGGARQSHRAKRRRRLRRLSGSFAARDGGEPCTADEERLCARLLAELRVNTSLLCTLRTPTAAEAAANNDRGGRKKPKGELEAALKQAGKAGGVK